MPHRASKVVLALAAILVVVAAVNFAVVLGINSEISSKKEVYAADLAEKSRPAEISITTIAAANCADCFDIGKVVSSIKSSGLKIISEKTLDYTSADAKALIQKYGIEKSPALVITGEIDKPNAKSAFSKFGKLDDAIVFSEPLPVYINLSDGSAVGRVSATLISADSCTQCGNISLMLDSLKRYGVVISGEKKIDYSTSEAKQIVSKYNITAIPALLFSKDISEYREVTGTWENIGTVANDGTYVLRILVPPYINTTTGKTYGIVSLTKLEDKSCTECYNVSIHKNALLAYGITPAKETTYDINSAEGKALLSKYNITLVPTIILSGDVSAYTQLAGIWPNVGKTETDGSYVFTAVSQMGTYKDLTSNKTIKAANTPQ